MNGKTRSVMGTCVAVVAITAASTAAAGAFAQQAESLTPRVEQTTVQQILDPGTGLEVRVSQSPGEVVMDLGNRNVAIHKEMRKGQSITTLSGAGDRITFDLDLTDLVIVRPTGVVHVGELDVDGLNAERGRLAASPLVRAAVALLAKVALPRDSMVGNSLLLTRAFLGAASKDDGAGAEYRKWVESARRSPRVTGIGFQKTTEGGPGACWDTYVRYVMKIADEFVDCKRPLRWYDLLGGWRCDFVWALQAELAMDWLIACNGGLAK